MESWKEVSDSNFVCLGILTEGFLFSRNRSFKALSICCTKLFFPLHVWKTDHRKPYLQRDVTGLDRPFCYRVPLANASCPLRESRGKNTADQTALASLFFVCLNIRGKNVN